MQRDEQREVVLAAQALGKRQVRDLHSADFHTLCTLTSKPVAQVALQGFVTIQLTTNILYSENRAELTGGLPLEQ